MNCVQETRVARLVALWMGAIVAAMSVIASHDTNIQIFRIGPNETLIIFGIVIDTAGKYIAVIAFCFLNSGIRTLNHNILQPYIINVIQDKENPTQITYKKSYELSFVYTIYNWFDFFMYMNILMSQIDMLMVEITADLIITFVLTTDYVKSKNKITIDEKEPLLCTIHK
jgi:hypothetical protein